jgi:hypothetical protein
MIKLSELPVNTLIDIDTSAGAMLWIKDSVDFWTPVYAATKEAQESHAVLNDEADNILRGYTIRSLPVGYSLPEPPEEFIEKRQRLAAFLLYMATGHYWEESEGLDNFHENYTKDADDIIKTYPHLLGLETREVMGLI